MPAPLAVVLCVSVMFAQPLAASASAHRAAMLCFFKATFLSVVVDE
jgi:hypothetical protein